MPFTIYSHRRWPLTYFMGFWLLIILPLLSRGLACAEWVWISFTKRGAVMTCTPTQTLFAAMEIW